jgi:hypothetical protein
MSKKENMSIWTQVETSDPDSIKQVSFGRKFSAINAHHQVKKATEIFGAFGQGWGVTNERFQLITAGLILYQATLWWRDSSKENVNPNQFDISSSILHTSKNGHIDDECVKKVATDALTKGLSKLGFNADIFLGLWDDNKYVNQVKEEAARTTESHKAKELQVKANGVMTDAQKFAKDGDVDGIAKLWRDNPDLHNVTGFSDWIGEAGKKAKAVKAEKDGDKKEDTEG